MRTLNVSTNLGELHRQSGKGGKSLRRVARQACHPSQVKDFPSPDGEANGGGDKGVGAMFR